MKYISTILLLTLIGYGCSDIKQGDNDSKELKQLKAERDSLNSLVANFSDSKGKLATFLTFQKANAEQAMNFYVGLFENSKIDNIKRWGKEGPGREGTIMHATFNLNGQLFMCSDSPAIHEWDFSPAVSNYVECKNDIQLEKLFSQLSDNGKILMPLNNYGFSQKFGFVEDQFGVSWQLNLQ